MFPYPPSRQRLKCSGAQGAGGDRSQQPALQIWGQVLSSGEVLRYINNKKKNQNKNIGACRTRQELGESLQLDNSHTDFHLKLAYIPFSKSDWRAQESDHGSDIKSMQVCNATYCAQYIQDSGQDHVHTSELEPNRVWFWPSAEITYKRRISAEIFFSQSELKQAHPYPSPTKLRYWNCDRGVCALGRQFAAQLFTTHVYVWCPSPLPRCLEISQQILQFVREAGGTLMEHNHVSLVTWGISALPKLSVHFPAALKTSSTMWKRESL